MVAGASIFYAVFQTLKTLRPFSLAVSQSPKLLKSVVGGGKVLIRPIQQDLDLDLDKQLIALVEVCATLITSTHINLCQTTMIVLVGYGEVHPLERDVPMQSLRKHVQGCRFER